MQGGMSELCTPLPDTHLDQARGLHTHQTHQETPMKHTIIRHTWTLCGILSLMLFGIDMAALYEHGGSISPWLTIPLLIAGPILLCAGTTMLGKGERDTEETV